MKTIFRKRNKHFPKINKEICFEPKTTPKQKNTNEKVTVCSICYQEKNNIQYINCIKGYIQDINFGRGSQCLKCICKDCKSIIINKKQDCPFCRNHKLKNKKKIIFPKKKKPFYQREIDRKKKILIKYFKNHLYEKYKDLYKDIYGYYPSYNFAVNNRRRKKIYY
tara:strand:+ start:228 stop:722 length:495 start_codon:yes stop_codon:yes gene_type:complete